MEAVEPLPGLLMLVYGPSGGGKTTVMNALLKRYSGLEALVSATTRPIRQKDGVPQEKDGVDYHFVSEDAFEERVQTGEIFEHTSLGKWRYGMSARAISRQLGRCNVIKAPNWEGVTKVREAAPKQGWKVVSVFIDPGEIGVIEKRLRGRGGHSAEEIQTRLAQAAQEMKYAHLADRTFVSGTPEQDLESLSEVYLQALTARGIPLPLETNSFERRGTSASVMELATA